MQTLANLRLLAELSASGDFTIMERMSMEKVLDNANKKAAIELERIYNSRQKMEARRLKEEQKLEARRLKEAQKMEARRIKEEQKLEARRLKECHKRRIVQMERAWSVGFTFRCNENRQDYINSTHYRFGFPLILNSEEENLLYEMREIAMENIRLRDVSMTKEEREKTDRIKYLESKPRDCVKECGICYEKTMCILNYKCVHSFCEKCLVGWSKCCPICRSE